MKKFKEKIKFKCNKCNTKIDGILKSRDLSMMGYKKRTNYPLGKKSGGRTTIFCSCGGIFIRCAKKEIR